MKSIVKTAGSFDKVLASCKSIGGRYQPSTPSLGITALSEMSGRSQQAMQAVILTRAAYRLAVFSRRESFAGIPKLSVRVVNMLAASGAPSQALEAAQSLKNQLQQRSKRSPQATTQSEPVPTKRAATRKHFEMRTETFTNLVRIVEGIANYAPNEDDLKLEALLGKVDELIGKSSDVDNARVDYTKARQDRNKLMFGPHGIDETLQAVKRYIRGAFGVNSPEANQMADAE